MSTYVGEGFKDKCPDCGLYPCELEPYWAWEAEYRPLLGGTARWEGFSFIMKDLLARKAPVGLMKKRRKMSLMRMKERMTARMMRKIQ